MNEALDVLKDIKGEIIKLRNDVLMLRVAIESIESTVDKIERKSSDQELMPMPNGNLKNML